MIREPDPVVTFKETHASRLLNTPPRGDRNVLVSTIGCDSLTEQGLQMSTRDQELIESFQQAVVVELQFLNEYGYGQPRFEPDERSTNVVFESERALLEVYQDRFSGEIDCILTAKKSGQRITLRHFLTRNQVWPAGGFKSSVTSQVRVVIKSVGSLMRARPLLLCADQVEMERAFADSGARTAEYWKRKVRTQLRSARQCHDRERALFILEEHVDSLTQRQALWLSLLRRAGYLPVWSSNR